MSEHLTADQLSGFARRTLAPDGLLAVDAHLAACASCREKLGDQSGLKSALRSLRQAVETSPDEATAHLTYEQLEAHAEGISGPAEQEIIAGHLGWCDPCSAEARDLAAFVRSARSGREDAGQVAPAVRRFPAPALLLALAATVVVAVTTAWLVPASLRRQVRELQEQIGDLRQRNEALSQQVAHAGTPVAGQPAVPPAVALNDHGGTVGLDASGNLIGLDALTVSEGRMIAAALRSGRAETPASLKDLVGSPGVLLGEPEQGSRLEPITPVGTIVRGTRPVFTWRPLPGADSYTVAIYDPDFNPIARSEPLARTSWTPAHSLNRGALYVWQVIARRGKEEITFPAPPAPEARFKVLAATESTALDHALRAAGASHLAAGVLLARAGCVDEARKEFEALLKQNPGSQVARDLTSSIAGPRLTIPPTRR